MNTIEELEAEGFRIALDGEDLILSYPRTIAPSLVAEAREELRQHKQEIILALKGYRLKYTDAQDTAQELEEIAQTVYGKGYVLLWSKELSDLVAFYRDEEAKSEIPPGFVAYSVKELGELFGDNPVSDHELRLIHEAKKYGHIISREAKG